MPPDIRCPFPMPPPKLALLHSNEQDDTDRLLVQLMRVLEEAQAPQKKQTLLMRANETLGVDDEDPFAFTDVDPTTILDLCATHPRKFRLIDASSLRQIFQDVLEHPKFMEAAAQTSHLAKTAASSSSECDASSSSGNVSSKKVDRSRRNSRQSFPNPDDFSIFRGTKVAQSPNALSHERRVGGPTPLDDSSLKFASNGGGAGGFGEGACIHDPAYMTKEAKDRQIKQRAKIDLNSLDKVPDWDGENESWADFSKHFIDLMTTAGYDLVCRPHFLQNALILKWDPEDVVEARKLLYRQLGVATFKHKLARDAFVLAGPKHDGETVFHQLELENALLSFSDEAEVRENLRVFKPTARESPVEMMARLTALANKHNKLEDA